MAFDYGYNGGYAPQGYGGFVPKQGYAGGCNAPQRNDFSPWIYVPTVKDVQSVQVQPGQKIWVMVQNECVFALRAADNMGIVSTDFYRFEKIDADTAAPSEFVTRKEFEEFIKTLKGEKENEQSVCDNGTDAEYSKNDAGKQSRANVQLFNKK